MANSSSLIQSHVTSESVFWTTNLSKAPESLQSCIRLSSMIDNTAAATVAKYMSYITDQGAPPPLVRKAVLTQKVMASKNKFTWWNNSWRILEKFHIQRLDPSDFSPKSLKEDVHSQYCCWWLKHLANPSNAPSSTYTDSSRPPLQLPPILIMAHTTSGPALLRFRCSNHRLDIELGRHLNKPREEDLADFAKKQFWVMNIMRSSARPSCICRFSVVSMSLPTPSSLRKCNPSM